MKKINVSERIEFLAEKFNVTDFTNNKIGDGFSERIGSNVIKSKNTNEPIAIIYDEMIGENKFVKKIKISIEVLTKIIEADPTENKVNTQWMLTVFTRFIQNNELDAAIRFVEEDLPQANNYLTIFEANKRKRKFIELAKTSFTLIGVKDPSNINQYKSLAQLFDAVVPFIDRVPSVLEKSIQKFVDSGQALMPHKDRKYTLYIPLTNDASVAFDKFTNWCTAREGNGMFKSYTEGHKKPNGENSNLYIIINNDFFNGTSNELYQIHFETNQVKDNKNGSNVSIYDNVISVSEGIRNYFYHELKVMAKDTNLTLDKNKYLDYLIQFGFAETLFELIDDDALEIKFTTREVPKLPDISRFKNLKSLVMMNSKLRDIDSSVGRLTNLEMLILTNNKFTSIPKDICYLSKLIMLNLVGNKILEIPDEIKNLDKSNGGSLNRLSISKSLVGDKIFKRLTELLPNVTIVDVEHKNK